MARSTRPRKTAKRPAKKKPSKTGALIRFTATQKGKARQRPRADGGDGGVWLLILPPTWIKYSNKSVNKKTKQAALKALKKFRKG